MTAVCVEMMKFAEPNKHLAWSHFVWNIISTIMLLEWNETVHLKYKSILILFIQQLISLISSLNNVVFSFLSMNRIEEQK